jgi:hypothetical protein
LCLQKFDAGRPSPLPTHLLSSSQLQVHPSFVVEHECLFDLLWGAVLLASFCQCPQKFDAGRCSPLLTHLLSSGKLQVQGKKTIVPGCG